MSKPGYPKDRAIPVTVHNSYTDHTGHTTSGTDTCVQDRLFEDKSGDNSPGWPAVKQVNYYLRSKFTWNQSPLSVSATVHQSGGDDISEGNFGDAYGASNNPWADTRFGLDHEVIDVYNRLIYKMINQIQSHRVDLGEIFHTRQQTANLVGDTARKLAEALWNATHGQPGRILPSLLGHNPPGGNRIRPPGGGRVSSLLGGIPNEWLAFQYGWKPLYQDVYNSCQNLLDTYNEPTAPYFTASASATASASDKTLVYDRAVPWGPRYELKCTNRSVKGKAEIHYSIDSRFGSNLSQFGISNPAATAWEIVPYSFVVDWFLPIGPFISAMGYSQGLGLRDAWWSYHANQEVSQRVMDTSVSSGNIDAHFSGASGSGSAFVFERHPMEEFPLPPLPSFKDPLTLTHLSEGLSLLSGVVSGTPPHKN